MSSNELEPFDEDTPLLPPSSSNRLKPPVKKSIGGESETTESLSADHKYENSSLISSNNLSLCTNDGNNNSNDLGEDTPTGSFREQEIRVYAKRWYILTVFSLLGVLQVRYIL